ncbi:hypothetical protein M436DRAFT_47659 [Aureobasidium namibiae CBS 147.97]|uniref:Uncharacterized protein n=1 Tax=Aureobasidium namibiae CBS 147.97 TaxID=1043004 RepID=A0A074WTI7_9PEZI|nr:uncharacterized protein M436DRAFT_47659 [Aureobasidium namibiae CBS 147.97]KEQ73062.1 hypothetical protein M436DRAFT_47659 [Aureobasidium namibiae CBS 147.97]
MLALLKDTLSLARALSITNRQPRSGYGLVRLFSSSHPRIKFRRHPTEAELLEMSPSSPWYYKTREDPESRRRRNMHQKLVHERVKQRRQDDPEYNLKVLSRWRNKSKNEDHRLLGSLRRWLTEIPASQREAYAWKTHLSVVFPEKQRFTCIVCADYPANSRVWWKRLDGHTAPATSDAQEYTCHSCYMDQDSFKIYPVEFENHVPGPGKKKPKPYKPY